MDFQKKWIEVETVISLLNNAAKCGEISRRDAEILIMKIYHETNKNPFKTK